MSRNFILTFLLLSVVNIEKGFAFINDINQLKSVKLNTSSVIDKKCQNQLENFTTALERRDDWALESNKAALVLHSLTL